MTEFIIKKDQEVGKGHWDERVPDEWVMSPEIGSREDKGLSSDLRKERNPQIWDKKINPLDRGCELAPRDLQDQFEDVFGLDRVWEEADPSLGRPLLMLVYDPFYKRYCIYERETNVPNDTDNWCLVSRFQHVPDPERPPLDIVGDIDREHMLGRIGEFREPTYADYMLIEQTDAKKYTPKIVDDLMAVLEEIDEKESEAQVDAMADELIEWYAWADMRAHSGDRLMFTHHNNRSIHYTEGAGDPRWYVIQRVGEKSSNTYMRYKRKEEATERELLTELMNRWELMGSPEVGVEFEDMQWVFERIEELNKQDGKEERKARLNHFKEIKSPLIETVEDYAEAVLSNEERPRTPQTVLNKDL